MRREALVFVMVSIPMAAMLSLLAPAPAQADPTNKINVMCPNNAKGPVQVKVFQFWNFHRKKTNATEPGWKLLGNSQDKKMIVECKDPLTWPYPTCKLKADASGDITTGNMKNSANADDEHKYSIKVTCKVGSAVIKFVIDPQMIVE